MLPTGKPAGLAMRLDAVLAALPAAADGTLTPDSVAAITRSGHDSPHQLVMELHKRLNAMQTDIAEETLDGAAVYALADTDRPLVTAFMAGLHRTAALKFDHPGLATTATRAGGKLVIQNDIGTTDAHVLVVPVRTSPPASSTTTCTPNASPSSSCC